MKRAVLPPPPERAVPLVRTTWITKLLSGENKCEWALWFQWRYEVPPEPMTPEGQERIDRHARLVRERAAELKEYGWNVLVEWENLRELPGQRTGTILSGKADITVNEPGKLTFEECKTGREFVADHVQVLIYAQLAKWLRVTKPMVGNVIRENGVVESVNMDDRLTIREAYIALLDRVTGGSVQRVPEYWECTYCKVRRYCPDRAIEKDKADDWTELVDDRR